MRSEIFKKISLVLMIGTLSFFSVQTLSQTAEQTGSTSVQSTQAEKKHHLANARLKLHDAQHLYSEGNVIAAKTSLQEASQWLNRTVQESNDEKTQQEAQKLAVEIDTLYKRLEDVSEEDKNVLARILHRTTALLSREIDSLVHRYTALSTAERTLKPLLDAKMHFYNAEHDLFVDHDVEYATEELDKTLDYLKDASEVAIPRVQKRIDELRQKITRLKTDLPNKTDIWSNETITKSLDTAIVELDKAKQGASPDIERKINRVKDEIETLHSEVMQQNAKRYYDAVSASLQKLITEL